MGTESDFLAGVIEGFYGRPWSMAERMGLLDWMRQWGLNTYLYAPKDDLKQRAFWRELYDGPEAEALRRVIDACRERGVSFIYALSPGLDVRYHAADDMACLRRRLEQMLQLGCYHFALLFDDIPDRLGAEDLRCFGSFALAQAALVNEVFHWLREQCQPQLFFCPTAYCGRMADGHLGGEDYLGALGRALDAQIEVFWTGPEIISREIPIGHIDGVASLLERKPVIWDNLHANDYDGRRFYVGPYAGRAPELKEHVRGLMCNPNNELPLNYVPLRTFAEFVQVEGPWEARAAYLAAMGEWHHHFRKRGEPVTREELVLLGDCYYLPHELGPEAEDLLRRLESIVVPGTSASGKRRVAETRHGLERLASFCAKVTQLEDRELFYALSRRTWDLREEVALLVKFIECGGRAERKGAFRSEFHLPGTYRGGILPRLQGLLEQRADGSFAPGKTPVQPGAGVEKT